jgi:hypothetical protein
MVFIMLRCPRCGNTISIKVVDVVDGYKVILTCDVCRFETEGVVRTSKFRL